MRFDAHVSRSLPSSRKRIPTQVGLLIALFVVGLLAGCGSDDDSNPVATPDMADVNTFVASLNSWPVPSATVDGPTGELPEDGNDTVGGQDYDCTSTPYSITQTPDKIVVFDPDDEIFWLGSMLQGTGYRGGLGSLSELPIRQRAPINITVDILGAGATRTVNDPSPTTVNAAIGELITLAENSGQTFSSDILFQQTKSHSVQQSAIKMGLSANYMGAQVSASLNYDQDASQTTMSAYFLQKMFTTSMTLPQLPEDLFSSDFTAERLQEQVDLGRIGPNNQPTYISSIVWGRLMMLTITSSSSETDIRAALSASYDGVSGGGSGSIDASSLNLLQNASIQLVTLGGDQAAALGFLRSGTLSEFFAEDAPLTSAVALSFTVRDVQTNEKALVSETTSYNIRTCTPVVIDPIGSNYRVRLDALDFANANCDGGGYFEAYWNITANSPVSSYRPESNPLDAYTGNVVSISTPYSTDVPVYFNGTGAITISGSLYDDDSFGDDVIANWDINLNTNNITVGQFSTSGGSPEGESCRVNLRYTIVKGADIYPPK